MRVNCVPRRGAVLEDDVRGNGNTAILALLSFAMLLVSLDQYIVVVALPEIGRDLGYSAHTLQSVVSAYAVASSGFLLFGGRAADLLGRRRVLVMGLALYAFASLAGGLATRPEVQLTARAVQGLGGALVFPSTLAVINTTFAEGRDRNRALGIWGGAGAAGLVVGVLFGGVLTRAFGWEAVFLINVPLAAAALIAAFVVIEPDRVTHSDRKFDIFGALTATGAVSLLLFALVQGPETGWSSPRIIVAIAAGLLLLATFTVIERRSCDPIAPPAPGEPASDNRGGNRVHVHGDLRLAPLFPFDLFPGRPRLRPHASGHCFFASDRRSGRQLRGCRKRCYANRSEIYNGHRTRNRRSRCHCTSARDLT
jgi:MFS family permease